MKILHYGLGFPPYRTGGLTKFTVDLMKQQIKMGHDVSLLWPGQIKLFGRKNKITYRGTVDGINSYEIINPTPVSYDEGISNIDPFVVDGELEVYDDFFHETKPQVLHVQTLMGIHRNLLVSAKNHGVRIVFSTHDFFPICPKVTMFRKNDVCRTVKNCEYCYVCNQSALSLYKMILLQSPFYRGIKNLKIVSRMRQKHRNEFLGGNECSSNFGTAESTIIYKKLRDYYRELLGLMDVIHYNSLLTKKVYEKYMGNFDSEVIPISHNDIQNHIHLKKFDHDVLHLVYLGPYGRAKGFFFLKNALDEVWEKKRKFIIDVFFEVADLPEYVNTHERYTYDDLEKIFDSVDALIVPSVWYETFGYTVAEALSYGVPVIVSSHVGAQDIIPNQGGIVYTANSKDELVKILIGLDSRKLESMNASICETYEVVTLNQMAERLYQILYK
jgi:glycosyltransferase involved in cell wall biosynthesis